uniref:Uncharacterized protein LOC113798688 n=1 Tax=Dermatophagoides pteronyssinus TaxID=6956 RepID=A0A6P6YJY3_DERPT|nr:uncharacterized protein LOC113798688 [Dermatophagoides pteronyssinus]
MSTIQTIGAGLYVIRPDYFQKFAFIGTFARFNPSEGREYFLTAWTIAAFSVVIMMFYCLPTRAKKFQFLRILRLNENNNHYLDDDEFKRFKQLRERIFSIVRTFALIIELVNPFGFIPIIIELEAYKISMFWTIIWFIIVHVNLWYLSVAQYFGPIFVSLLQYYFRLRQRNLKKRLIRLQKIFQQYNQLDDQQQQQLINQRILFRQINVEIYRINRLYGKLRQEIYSASKQLRRFVTTIFIDLSLQATYLISVVVYTKLAPAITLVILQITTGITTMLIIFMYSSSMLEYEDRKFFTIKQQCLHFFYLKRNIVTSKNLIKVCFVFFSFFIIMITFCFSI